MKACQDFEINCFQDEDGVFAAQAPAIPMERRGVSRAEVEDVIRSPGQVLPGGKGRQIYQSKLGHGGRMLLRVVVKEDSIGYHVVTAYKTSKVSKYWREP
ncbi:MAG: DUF4258 domain-containing protein [Planctomycetes bacterium]|nr:DUF4258 domain-containing protein [Planctomycetota bacterium]